MAYDGRTDNSTLADLLKKHCAKHGLSQHELAQVLGLSDGLVSLLLSGRRETVNKSTAERIAAALGIPLTDVLDIIRQQRIKRMREGNAGDQAGLFSEFPVKYAASPSIPYVPGQFTGREGDLLSISNWFRKEHERCLILTGPGGQGKTALANAWINICLEDRPACGENFTEPWKNNVIVPLAERPGCIFFWSFREFQGSGSPINPEGDPVHGRNVEDGKLSAFLFCSIDFLMGVLNAAPLKPVGEMNSHEQVLFLLQLLHRGRILLVLDGIEELVRSPDCPSSGQWTPAALFLHQVSHLLPAAKTRCLMTCRYIPGPLKDSRGQLSDECKEHRVEGLSELESLRFLQNLSTSVVDDDRFSDYKAFAGNPRLLQLYLKKKLRGVLQIVDEGVVGLESLECNFEREILPCPWPDLGKDRADFFAERIAWEPGISLNEALAQGKEDDSSPADPETRDANARGLARLIDYGFVVHEGDGLLRMPVVLEALLSDPNVLAKVIQTR